MQALPNAYQERSTQAQVSMDINKDLEREDEPKETIPMKKMKESR